MRIQDHALDILHFMFLEYCKMDPGNPDALIEVVSQQIAAVALIFNDMIAQGGDYESVSKLLSDELAAGDYNLVAIMDNIHALELPHFEEFYQGVAREALRKRQR